MKIVAPVARFLGVRDAERAAAFFRDVLDFEIHQVEGDVQAVLGPACLRFKQHDFEPFAWDNPREPGSSVVFFEVDDLDVAHAELAARGARPGSIAQINRVKMRAFEVRDPDGHALWFGQSYDEPDQPRHGMMETIMPCMPLGDVARGVEYYRSVFGFTVNHQQEHLAVLHRDRIRVLLVARTPNSGVSSAYVYVENADQLYAELTAKGARIEGPPVSYPWGLRSFRVFDLEDNEIEFGQPFE